MLKQEHINGFKSDYRVLIVVYTLCLANFIEIPAQTPLIKTNLGPEINDHRHQTLPICSSDSKTIYFSELSDTGFYEVWYAEKDENGNFISKKPYEALNLNTFGDKFVFSQIDSDLLLVNGKFEKVADSWIQTKGLSWYIISENRFIPLEIENFHPDIKNRIMDAFIHKASRTLFLSFRDSERKNIYISTAQNIESDWTRIVWSKPRKLPAPINSTFDDSTPFLDVQGNTIYFSSNRPGGFGNEDIYRAYRKDASWQNWSKPINLGYRINTKLSELNYKISPDKKMAYFISDEHSLGLGDIFSFQDKHSKLIFNSFKSPFGNRESASEQALDEANKNLTTKTNLDIKETNLDIKLYKPNNLVFLIDRSGSMKNDKKMELVQQSLSTLIKELRDIDKITILSFADKATLHYTTTNTIQKDSLYHIIENLEGSGSTKANKGLQMAYSYVDQNFMSNGNNEIFLLTDGHFELSKSDKRKLESHPEIVLSIVGIGKDVKALAELRKLADISKGSYINIRRLIIDTQALLEEVKLRSKF